MGKQIWTKEKIIEAVKTHIDKHGVIRKNDLNTNYKKYNLPHASSVKKNFNSLDEFALNINILFDVSSNSKLSKEKILKNIHKIIKPNTKISKKDFQKLILDKNFYRAPTICKYFGTLDNFAKEANIKFIVLRKKWNKQKIINAIHNIINNVGPIKKNDLYSLNKKYNICHIETIIRHFETIDKFVKEANIQFIETNKHWTKKTIINAFNNIMNIQPQIKKTDLNTLNKKFNICEKNTIIRHFGSLDEFIKNTNFEFQKTKFNTLWPKNKIINNMKKILKYYKNIKKSDIDKLRKQNKIHMCSSFQIKRKFKTLDNFADEVGFKFISSRKNIIAGIGKNEKQILDEYEKINNIKLKRQYAVFNGKSYYKIDGYDFKNNIAYEVDEKHHYTSTQQMNDKLRQKFIIDKLGCNFVRINEQQFLARMEGQKNLGDF